MAAKKKKSAKKAKAAKKPAKVKDSARMRSLNEWYSKQLEEKNNEIKRLKMENSALLATALKQSKRTKEIFERAEKAMKKKK